jgi:hypothetical protein
MQTTISCHNTIKIAVLPRQYSDFYTYDVEITNNEGHKVIVQVFMEELLDLSVAPLDDART